MQGNSAMDPKNVEGIAVPEWIGNSAEIQQVFIKFHHDIIKDTLEEYKSPGIQKILKDQKHESESYKFDIGLTNVNPNILKLSNVK